MSCVLRASGIDFDADVFLKTFDYMKPCAIFKKGETRYPNSNPYGKKFDISGLNFSIGLEDHMNFNKQVDDAIDYLKKNESFIKSLVKFNGIDFVSLDFGVEEVTGWPTYTFPIELILAASRLNIALQISIYPQG
jgi:hypothetical protein